MSQLILRQGLWLLVCDAQKALLLRNTGTNGDLKLETEEVFKQDNPLSHEQASAPPGRVFASDGRRAATEETDFHRQASERFLAGVVERVNGRVARHEIDALAVIAPPKALGILRPLLSQQARHILVAELERDYTKTPIQEIERSLTALQGSH